MAHHGRPVLTREDVARGLYVLIPRTYQLVLAVVTIVLSLLVLIPSWIFFKKAVVFQVGYVALPLAVGWAMRIQSISRHRPELRYTPADSPHGDTWLRVFAGSDRVIGATALVAALLIAIQMGFLIAGLANCSTLTAQSLATQIWPDLPTNCSTVTDWNALYRSPYFATAILTYQMCFDDYAFTITYVVVMAVLMVDMLLVAVQQYMTRQQTRWLVRAAATRELVQSPDIDDGPRLHIRNPREVRDELAAAAALAPHERRGLLTRVVQLWLN